ncbi:MAG: DUF4280 domain-containing protein [Janthinobacterium lividum]
MDPEVVTGAIMECAGGGAKIVFDGLPNLNVLIQFMPSGTFSDIAPELNLIPAGTCSILADTTGIPFPCTPIPVDPWITGVPNVLINGSFALGFFSMLPCAIGGVISIVFPNNETVLLY